MALTSITNQPVFRGIPEAGCQAMNLVPHQDASHIPNAVAVSFPNGCFRGVDDFGNIDDTKTGTPGSGELFVHDPSTNIAIAPRKSGDYWFVVA